MRAVGIIKKGWMVAVTLSLALAISAPGALAASLDQNDINSIYYDTVWYDTTPLSQCTSAGGGVGAQFPTNLQPSAMTQAINTWMRQYNPKGELNGLGSTIVASSQHANVSPFLIVAIGWHESHLDDPSVWNVQNANNGFGRTATDQQPHVAAPDGSRLWYKWNSVKASVDYTAPENQNAIGGGDMASYLRDEYGSQIDDNNLVAMIMKYAPPTENNTAQYIADIQKWLSELTALASGSSTPATTSNNPSCSAGCPNGTTASGNMAILCEAEKYSGIYYKLGGGHGYSAFRQACPENAISSAASSSTPNNPGPCATDCSGLVSVAVDAVFNKSYAWTVLGTGRMSLDGSNPDPNWKSIPIAQASAGDIVTTHIPDAHVEIVDHVSGSTVYTFGSHSPGKRTGAINASSSYWVDGAWRWVGAGGS